MTRNLILLPVLLILASAPPSVAQDGSQLFLQRCGDCHGARAIGVWGRKLPNDEQRRQWLEGVLATHHSPPETERALIIDHIQSQNLRR
jgi:mono/diheme cytochrome c family protein